MYRLLLEKTLNPPKVVTSTLGGEIHINLLFMKQKVHMEIGSYLSYVIDLLKLSVLNGVIYMMDTYRDAFQHC